MDANEAQRRRAVIEKMTRLLQDMYAHSKADDDLALFLRFHLHLENALTDRLVSIITNQGAFDWESDGSPQFMQRARMAFALGILDEAGYRFARTAASIRNQLAHRLNRELSENDATALRNNATPAAVEVAEILSRTSPDTDWQKRPDWKRQLIGLMWFQIIQITGPDDFTEFLFERIRTPDASLPEGDYGRWALTGEV